MLARLTATAAATGFGAWARRHWWERPDRQGVHLMRMVDRFECALRDVPYELARPLHARIHRGRTALDFWHMRTDVFNVVSKAFGQREAQARIAQLNDLFGSAGKRSGPIPL